MEKLRFIPLGGLGEIGKNMALLEYHNHAIMIDAGLMFPDDQHFGIDYIIPDFNAYIDRPGYLKAILLTHAHEDHIGALPYLLQKVNVPIYGTKLTLGLVQSKLMEFSWIHDLVLKEVQPRKTYTIDVFRVEFIRVTHSIADSCGLAIQTPVGIVIHTGDFKIDSTPIDGITTDLSRFAEYGEKGVLLLLSDSTNVERKGISNSEKNVGEKFDNIFPNVQGKIIVTCFSSNIHRIQQVINSARKIGRKICILGRSMIRNTQVARELGYMHVPADQLILPENLQSVEDSQVVIITTGSQGEPMSSMMRMALDEHKDIKIHSGDLIIFSARTIPGNERAISRVINLLYKKGANVLYETISEIHATGHACQEEQKLMILMVKPKNFVPIHGEYRHLVLHAELAQSLGVPKVFVVENGDQLELNSQMIQLHKGLPVGIMMVDRNNWSEIGEVVLRDRKQLSADGVVVAFVIVDTSTGNVISKPELITRGFSENSSEEIIQEARELILENFNQEKYSSETNWNHVKEALRKRLLKFFFRKSNRRPMILPIIIEI